jgi:uncharacterized FlgJ-related protein
MKKLKNLLRWPGLLWLLLIGLLLALSFSQALRGLILKVIKVKPTSKVNQYAETDLIQKYVKDKGGDSNLAKMITAKAFVETGWFNSPVYLEGHNAFGMRCPRIRKNAMDRCSYTNSKLGYAIFKTLRASVEDYFLWWEYHKIGVKAMNFWSLRQLLQEEKDHNYYTTDVDSYFKKVNWFYERI